MSKNGTVIEADQAEEAVQEAKIVLAHAYDVNGQTVTFRERYPLSENRDLLKAWGKANTNDAATFIPLWAKMIDSWTFEGDPADAKSYDALDVVSELWPLMSVTLRFWNQRFSVTPKNSLSVSTSP
jgi:hypothetical protein